MATQAHERRFSDRNDGNILGAEAQVLGLEARLTFAPPPMKYPAIVSDSAIVSALTSTSSQAPASWRIALCSKLD